MRAAAEERLEQNNIHEAGHLLVCATPQPTYRSIYIYRSTYLSIYLYLSIYIYIYIDIYIHTCMHIYLSLYLPRDRCTGAGNVESRAMPTAAQRKAPLHRPTAAPL